MSVTLHAMISATKRLILFLAVAAILVLGYLAYATDGFTKRWSPWLDWSYTHFSPDLETPSAGASSNG